MGTQTRTPIVRLGGTARRHQVSNLFEKRGPATREINSVASEIPTSPHKNSDELNQLVLDLIPLVKRVAMQMRRRLPSHIELDDLVSAGILGLIEAIQKFDAKRGVKIAHYATHRIRGAILDDIRAMDAVPRTLRNTNRGAERAHKCLEAKLGRPPSDHEMADALGMSLESWHRKVLEMLPTGIDWLRPFALVASPKSVPVSPDCLPADNEGHQFTSCYHLEQKRFLEQALKRIPARERLVIELYYRQELTMREIGERLGLDNSRISQLHSCALERLRRHVKDYD